MGILVHSLRVDDLEQPLGLDSDSFRFSWRLQGGSRDTYNTASQIWIATNRQMLLEHGMADVWDSGKLSNRFQHMQYKGPRLQSASRYWWKAAVWDASGVIAYSEPACFDTGLFEDNWTHAEWIWNSNEVQTNDYAYFRKEIVISRRVHYAKIFMSAHNTAQVFINGKRVGGYGSPAPTNPLKRKYYVAHDVTSDLAEGKSCISAIAHYLGGSGQNYINGLPGFRLQLEVVYEDGARQTWGTDTSWDILRELPRPSGAAYQQNRRISAVDIYDARKVVPGWQLPDLEQSAVEKAVIAHIPAAEWRMMWQELPEGAVEEVIIPREVTPKGSGIGRQVFDTGKIVSGWPGIRLEGISGVKLRMRYSEDLDAEGFVKHNVCNEKSDSYYDEYTMRGGEGAETWEPDLSYKAFRYVEMTGYPELILPGVHLNIMFAHTNIDCVGTFRCSNELLNEFFDAAIQTQKNNVLGQTVDCPHREQAQYLADSDLQAELLLYNFEARSTVEKVLSDFADSQLEDGTFPFVYPANYEHADFNLQIPEWDLHFCTLMWKLYWSSGDIRVLERYYRTAERMISYFFTTTDPDNGLVPVGKGWHISDWPYPTVEHSSSFLTVQNIKLMQATQIAADAARLIGLHAEANTYSQLSDNLRSSIIKHLYDPEQRRFIDGLGSEATHQGVNGLALYAGLVPAADTAAVTEYITGTEWQARTVLSLPMLRAMFENGKSDEAYKLISREQYPGWGYMLRQGAKTLWEGWDDKESHCHAWNGYPIRLLQEYVCGIQAVSPGFTDVRIRPFFPAGLRYAEASILTVLGPIHVRWEFEQLTEAGALIHLKLSIPSGASASLDLELLQPDNANVRVFEYGGTEMRPLASIGRKMELSSGQYNLYIRTFRES